MNRENLRNGESLQSVITSNFLHPRIMYICPILDQFFIDMGYIPNSFTVSITVQNVWGDTPL